MEIRKKEFGTTKTGEMTYLYELKNRNHMKAEITNYGATLVSLHMEDAAGMDRDLVLGYDSVTGYEENTNYFGATIGRNSNRIEHSSITINEKEFLLEANEKQNCLHSGPNGYSHRIWDVIEHSEGLIRLHLFSPDLDQGFPGDFELYVTYELTDSNELSIHYEATSTEDTIANLTNHTYFNLNGHNSGTILNHTLWIDADAYTPIRNSSCIPTGEIRPVEDTPMDFRTPKTIGLDIEKEYEQLTHGGGYDHNYVLHTNGCRAFVAKAQGDISNIRMEVYTDTPGVQFYAGNFISGSVGKNNTSYGVREGFCLETQQFPDAVHHQEFPTPVLKAMEKYDTKTIYKFYA